MSPAHQHEIAILEEHAPASVAPRRALPLLDQQADIRYLGTTARGVLNGPETTHMGFWSVNPYVGCAFGCAYCYARDPHRYVMERQGSLVTDGDDELAAMPAWLAFERRIVVKENAPELMRRTLRAMASHPERWQRLSAEGIVIGTATDPYQPAERRFRLTRGILEVLTAYEGLSVTVITKSPLITRDIDLLVRLGVLGRLTVHLTITTSDRDLARRIEPRAPTPEARLRALARLREAGVDVGVNIMPIMPGITDRPDALDDLMRRIAQAGATHVGACALRLRPTAHARYLAFVQQEFPELVARYRGAYAHGHELRGRYHDGLRAFMVRLCARHGVRFGYGSEDDDTPRARPTAPPPQLALAL